MPCVAPVACLLCACSSVASRDSAVGEQTQPSAELTAQSAQQTSSVIAVIHAKCGYDALTQGSAKLP